ncbi:alpha/beta hydrolase [Streptacidiphilus fuscans]|uniref:alpha/beta hydrolase n=1 Tax=Streptacidiphilus fuscans TaxID=2789292 RepID=UPI002E29134D|nr:alpha/beta-hydrolase family protein [Streptacidiphilus fuscans]
MVNPLDEAQDPDEGPDGPKKPEKPEEPEQPGPSKPARRWREHRKLNSLTLPGCWGALVASCLSFTPSLLPRGGVIQGVVWGISAVIGYGVGVLLASIWRAFADRDPRPPRSWAWRAFLISAAVLLVVFFGLGQYWQYLIRHMMGVSEYDVWLVVLSPLIAAAVFWILLLIGRGIRGVFRWTAERLGRRIGRRAARTVGWILVAGVTYLVITGLLLQGLVGLANDIFSVRDGATPEGVHQPTTALRSGGPGSLVPWDTLGRQGRGFVGSGPSQANIATLSHRPAMEPIRTYAGLGSADDTESRAALAVQDLERAGGFHRKNLLVVTTTGSGWVDPASVDSFDYLSGGDDATVAIQYSYLPSWISYLVDQSKAREAGRDLFDAVYGVWSQLPQASRPKLYVAGESLGSFGGETAFSGENDLANRTSGTLFVGPPNFNTLFREFSDHRDPGSPEIQPVYRDGRIVRFASDPSAAIPPSGQPWNGTRVLYLMHPSDPIVWWSPHLVFSEPDWIAETPGQDVLKGTVWIPFVTFWQVTADLPFSTGVPAGHGHKYTAEYVDAWNTVLRPSGFSPQDLDHLRQIIAKDA